MRVGKTKIGGKMKKDKFPKTIYAVRADGNTLLASNTFREFACTDEDVEVAVYQLVRVAKAKNKTVLA